MKCQSSIWLLLALGSSLGVDASNAPLVRRQALQNELSAEREQQRHVRRDAHVPRGLHVEHNKNEITGTNIKPLAGVKTPSEVRASVSLSTVNELYDAFWNSTTGHGKLHLKPGHRTKGLETNVTWLCIALIVAVSLSSVLQLTTQESGPLATPLTIFAFVCCSGSMLIVNKLAIFFTDDPALVLLLQFASCAAAMRVAGAVGLCEVEPLTFTGVRNFGLVAAALLGTMFMNMKVLQHTNVDTLILFRSFTPVLTVPLEKLLLGREFPDNFSLCTLLGVCVGTAYYVNVEREAIEGEAYLWLAAWLVMILLDTLFVKHVLNTVSMSTFTRSYYLNALGVFPLSIALAARGQGSIPALFLGAFDKVTLCVVGVSCFIGTALSHFAMHLRAQVSGTAFLVVGHSCKIITIVLNLLIWNRHASARGLFALGVCLLCASLFRDGPPPPKIRD